MRTAPIATRRRFFGAALAVVAAVGLGTASAAQLNVNASALAAGSAQVGDCQAGTAIRVELVSAWDTVPAVDRFTTSKVRVRNVAPACVGQTMSVTLEDPQGGPLAEVTLATLPVMPAVGYHELTLTTGLATSTIANAEVVIHS